MIKVVDGKRYNTETAEKVFGYWNGCSRSDFRFRTKKLYRTKNGAWFIHHDGGALTDMAVSVGNNGTGGSEDIEPVCITDAQAFLEAHSDDEEALAGLEKYFHEKIIDA